MPRAVAVRTVRISAAVKGGMEEEEEAAVTGNGEIDTLYKRRDLKMGEWESQNDWLRFPHVQNGIMIGRVCGWYMSIE